MIADSNDTLIRIADVSVAFERRYVLSDVSLNVNRGDFMAITGPNGGGKTTLLRVMLKLLKPSAGSVTYFDEGREVKRLHTGYLPQKNMIDTRFPIIVEEAVRSGLLHGLAGRGRSADDRRKMQRVVELCGIGDLLGRSLGDLSGGQLQRTLLARALVSEPKLLVLDEPLSYVDKRFEHQIYHIMEELRRSITIVLVSHEMSVISGMANRHLIIDHTVHQCRALHHYVPGECWPETDDGDDPSRRPASDDDPAC